METSLEQRDSPSRIEILSDEENKQLLQVLSSFAERLKGLGYDVPVHSSGSLARLSQTSKEKKVQVKEYFETWANLLQAQSEMIFPEISPVESEISCAKAALKHFGMSVDESFWKTVEKDHVIEIYGAEFVQLYRSLSFFKYSGYSLLDISLNEWYILWERPKRILEQIQENIVSVMSEYVPVKRLAVPRHVLKEILNSGDTTEFIPRATLIEFQNIGSLRKSPLGGNPCGLICSSTAEVIARGHDSYSISFV